MKFEGTPQIRAEAVAAVRRMDELGMNRGSTGNLSVRAGAGMLITPTGMSADELAAGFKKLVVRLYGDEFTKWRRENFRRQLREYKHAKE